jgi:hypothetical protein
MEKPEIKNLVTLALEVFLLNWEFTPLPPPLPSPSFRPALSRSTV